jgi:hypothetical protein
MSSKYSLQYFYWMQVSQYIKYFKILLNLISYYIYSAHNIGLGWNMYLLMGKYDEDSCSFDLNFAH